MIGEKSLNKIILMMLFDFMVRMDLEEYYLNVTSLIFLLGIYSSVFSYAVQGALITQFIVANLILIVTKMVIIYYFYYY